MVHSFLLQARRGDFGKEGLLLTTKSCLSMLLCVALFVAIPGNVRAAEFPEHPEGTGHG